MKFLFFTLVSFVALAACKYDSGEKKQADSSTNGQIARFDSNYCKCQIFTSERQQRFFSKRESIVKILLGENDSVAVFGFHTYGPKYGEEKLLFVGNCGLGYRTTIVLDSNANLVPELREYTRTLWLDLIRYMDSLPSISKAKIKNEFSHPVGYTLSLFTRGKRQDYCVCLSQYVVMQNNGAKKMLSLIKDMALNQE